ncbi:hypothetical protein PLESTB_000227800 [Pleodorina starrii]|uniref:Uncharacterized protein n=1 Tax=Pleodorina starrii TaxID=330485 RepID=A0A9W6BCB0_9CHLO|nr:hypothetical protein PLESTB_000227800 [Pleodorina starrii]GLC70004.1 hypothetical protein PLESTF_000911800 [Pleodorina starrii]
MLADQKRLPPPRSTIREARGSIQQRLEVRSTAVEDMLETTGGKLAVETHLLGQKTNWKFQGANEAFMEELKALHGVRELLDRNITSETLSASKEVKALKSKIRDLNSEICKTEQDLMAGVQQLARAHDTGVKMATQGAAQLPHIEAELREYAAGRQEPPGPAEENIEEEELSRQLAEEEARATKLEQQAALNAANRAADDAKYVAFLDGTRGLRDAVRELEEECNAEAKKQGAQHAERLQRFDMLAAALFRFTGVEVAEHDANSLRVTITQTIPRAMPGREQSASAAGGEGASQSAAAASQDPVSSAAEAGGTASVVAEHVLVLEFEDAGSVQLRAATLSPPAVDIDEAVKVAREAQAGSGTEAACALTALVLDVKARIRKHCRRQLQLEDAHDVYPLQPTSVSPELLRCVLPNTVEVEVLVPMAWPEEPGVRLQLVDMQASRISHSSAPLLARLQQELREAYEGGGAGGALAEARRRQLQNCSLRELLGWVYGSLAAEQQLAGPAGEAVC